MLKLILWGSVFWIAPLIAYMLVNETKFKKNLVLSVTFPQEARADGDVQREIRVFTRWTWGVCAGLLLLIVPAVLLGTARNVMTLWCVWLEACILLPYVPYVLARRRLLRLKAEKGWARERQSLVVDTAALPSDRWLSPWLFAPPVVLCLLPLLFDRDYAGVYGIFAGSCLLFWFGYRYLYRNKAEMVDDNAELTKALSQIRKYNWGKMWLITAYFMAACCVVMALAFRVEWLGILLTVGLAVLLCAAALRIELRTRRLQETLTKNSGASWYLDEDDRWIGGLLYYNPDDSRVIVNARIGINTTVNVARTSGKIIMGLVALLILGLPALGVAIDRIGTQEIAIQIEESSVVAKAGGTTYTVAVEDIDEITLLETLPDNLRRIVGTGTDTLLKGSFTSEQTGKATVLLDPTTGPFLLIRTGGGDCYLFGTRDPAETEALFAAITADRPQADGRRAPARL